MTYAGQVGAATFRALAYRAKVNYGRRAVSRPDRERDRLDLNPGMLAETAIGTFRTSQSAHRMSAFGGKAEVGVSQLDFRI
jgi:hypothetical protein